MAGRNIIQVTPFMLVPDIEPALAFMTDVLGFRVDYRAGDYAYVSREGAGLRMMAAGEGNVFEPGTRRFAYYFDCRDVDGLYAELKPKLDLLPSGHVCPPCDQDYGQREFTVIGPDGDIIAFGAAISDTQSG